MAYKKTTWVDEITPLDAANMNNIEEGIVSVDNRSITNQTNISRLNGSVITLEQNVTRLQQDVLNTNDRVDTNAENISQLQSQVNTNTEDISQLQTSNADKVNKQDINILQDVNINVQGDQAFITKTIVNLNNDPLIPAQQSSTEIIPDATEDQSGLMPSSTVIAINDMQEQINQLQGKATRLLYTASTTPTAEEINTFVVGEGYQSPFEGIAVVVDETFHVWHYYEGGTGWKDDGVDTVSNFTNTTAGIIKGSTQDGQVYANADGTGSVNGWDTTQQAISDLNTSKANTDATNLNSTNVDSWRTKLNIENFNLQDLPQFVSKIYVNFSLDDDGSGIPVLHGLLTLRFIADGNNVYINWGDGSGNFYETIDTDTNITHQYDSETFAGWITIYGSGISIAANNMTPSNRKVITDLDYSENRIWGFTNNYTENLTNLKSLKLPSSLTSYGGYLLTKSPLTGTQLKSFNIPENVTSFAIATLCITNNVVNECILPASVNTLNSGLLFGSPLIATVAKVTILNSEKLLTISTLSKFSAPNTTWFVPYNLFSTYKQSTNWTIFADKIYPIGGNYTESITIPSTSWDVETKTATVEAIGATSEDRNVVMPSIPSEYDDYGIRCTAQGTMTLTFTCDTIPTEDITIGVAYMLTNQ